jgi:hypothetical protein
VTAPKAFALPGGSTRQGPTFAFGVPRASRLHKSLGTSAIQKDISPGPTLDKSNVRIFASGSVDFRPDSEKDETSDV